MVANLKKHAVTPLTLPKVRKYLETLEAINEKIAVSYKHIIEVVDPADLQPHTLEYSDLFNKVLEVICEFEELKSSILGPQPSVSPKTTDLKLPRLTLL